MADSPPRLLRLPEVVRRTGLSRTTVYKLVNEGRFPAAVRLTPRTVAWWESHLDQWIAARLEASGEPGAQSATDAGRSPVEDG